MESLLWMLDLLAVAYLCFWALREDQKENAKPDADTPARHGKG
ncbi:MULTISPECIES: hypothetical protein [unclassified Massilia]|nr:MULTISPECIES: hypothetical protein [unclassified Massilia]